MFILALGESATAITYTTQHTSFRHWKEKGRNTDRKAGKRASLYDGLNILGLALITVEISGACIVILYCMRFKKNGMGNIGRRAGWSQGELEMYMTAKYGERVINQEERKASLGNSSLRSK